MTKEFKVGDKVRIKESYRDEMCIPETKEQAGKVFTVSKVERISYSDGYTVWADGLYFGSIHSDWLEHVPPADTIDPARAYRTRDGREVLRILCTDAPGAYPVVALVRGICASEAWFACKRTADGRECDGRRLDGSLYESGGDLIEVKPERSGWVNIYPGCVSPDLCFSQQYETKDLADSKAMKDRIACVYLKFREGDGLEGGK